MLSNDPTYPLFPIVAFLAAVLALLPIPFTLQAWNTGACALAVWAAAACLLSFINSVVWAGNVVDAVPVWCDISSKLLLGASIGIPAASLCTSHRLWKVSSTQSVPETRRDFLLTIAIDLAITVGVPILVMILHSIVQDHRYTIFEDIGCHASIANTLPAYFLVLIWPLVLSLASLILAVLCLRLSYVHRLRFDDALARKGAPRTCLCLRLILLVLVVATASVVAASLRIAAVASVELDSSTTFPSSISTSTTSSSTPLPSSSPSLLPAGTYRASALASAALEAERCVPVLCALVFFVLCGLSGEASYHARVARVAGKVWRRGRGTGKGEFKLPHPRWTDAKTAYGAKAPYEGKASYDEKTTYLGSLEPPSRFHIRIARSDGSTATSNHHHPTAELPPTYPSPSPSPSPTDPADDPFASTRRDPFAPADLSASRSRSLELCRSRSMYSERHSRAEGGERQGGHGERNAHAESGARAGLGRASSASAALPCRAEVPALPVRVVPPSPPAGAEGGEKGLPALPAGSPSSSPATLAPQPACTQTPRPTTPPTAHHAPQDSVTSLASFDSLATSLASARDKIYISDAYATDPRHAYHAAQAYYGSHGAASARDPGAPSHTISPSCTQYAAPAYYTTAYGAQPSPPPFSNLVPAPAGPLEAAHVSVAARANGRSPTPLAGIFGRRARSPSPVRVTVRMQREVEEV